MSDAVKVILSLLPMLFLPFLIFRIVRKRIDTAVRVARAEETATRAAVEERLRGRDEQLADARGALERAAARESELEGRASDLRAALAGTEEKIRAFTEAEKKLGDAFQSLAAQALTRNNQQFLDLAKENLEKLQSAAQGDLEKRQQAIHSLVEPLKEALGKVDEQVRQFESGRQEAYGALTEQVQALRTTHERLQFETGNLVKALRAPQVRGRWGEMQLKRAVEFAGLVDRVDFLEQETAIGEDALQRPDMIVRLPGGKCLVVDAKAPFAAYLEALEARDEDVRLAHLKDHARQVRDHVKKLSAKRYWSQFDNAPEFVVLFLPGETFFSAALEQDPTLIDESFSQSVVLATPTTLIALLKSVAYGWRQENMAANAQEISKAATELYDRVRVFTEHLRGVGKGIDDAMKSYNDAVGSWERKVVPQGRRIERLGAGAAKNLPDLQPLDRAVRALPLGEPDAD